MAKGCEVNGLQLVSKLAIALLLTSDLRYADRIALNCEGVWLYAVSILLKSKPKQAIFLD
ncbi:MAG: hypothetical protein EXR17_07060 [Flavobacteriaceae bacterium]|nr:hypothetical protein [Flavobacteriaceae bacterium]